LELVGGKTVHLIKASGETVLKKVRAHLFMLTVQYIPVSFKMIFRMDRARKLSKMVAFTLVHSRMVIFMESENTDNQTNRSSMRECG
jgi:hypothetical protein